MVIHICMLQGNRFGPNEKLIAEIDLEIDVLTEIRLRRGQNIETGGGKHPQPPKRDNDGH